MKKDNLNEKLIYILNAIFFFIFLFNILGNKNLVSILFSLTFIFVLILWLKNIISNFNNIDLLAIIIIVFCFISVSINLFASNSGFNLSYFKKVTIFSFTIMYFSTAIKISINCKNIQKLLKIMFIGISVACIYLYYTRNNEMYIFNGRISNYLCFNFNNPNETSIFLASLFLLGVDLFFLEKVRFIKILDLILLVFLIYFVNETRSRNALFTLILFLVLLIYILLKKKHIKFSNFSLLFGSLWPMIFCIFYMLSIKKLKSLLYFLISEGKTVDSRYYVWKYAFNNFKSSPIFGAYNQISNGTGTSQMFNTHLDILASYGIIVFILTSYFFYQIVKNVNSRSHDIKSKIFLLSFIAVLILGMCEAALVSGGLSIHILVGDFLIIACNVLTNEQDGVKNENIQ